MTQSQILQAAQIGKNFERVNLLAAQAMDAINAIKLQGGGFFLTEEDINALRQAETQLSLIKMRSNEWEAGKYAEKTINQ